MFLLEERYVEENSLYSYHVLVIHDIGTVQSTPVQIGTYVAIKMAIECIPIIVVTTDVQGVNFTRVDENIYFIQCSYLNGSDVCGCVYVLVSGEEGVENVTGFIERDSNGVTLEVANIGCYSEVLAYRSQYQLAASITSEISYVPSVQVRVCGCSAIIRTCDSVW